MFNITLTQDSFFFVDSLLQNKIDKEVSGPLYAAIIFFGFFILLGLIGTLCEIYNKYKTPSMKPSTFLNPEEIAEL